MKTQKSTCPPAVEKIILELGQNIKLARKRRKLSLQFVAYTAGISRSTLGLIEKGTPGVSLRFYIQVLIELRLEKDLFKVVSDDPLGRDLQDIALMMKS